MSETAQIEAGCEASEELKFVRFRLRGEEFACPVAAVSEIIRWREITPLPNAAADLLGLVNLRGRTMPVSDLSAKLGLGPTENREKGFIVVTDGEFGTIGLLVDSVSEVVSFTVAEVQTDKFETSFEFDRFAFGLVNFEGVLISILDIDKLVTA